MNQANGGANTLQTGDQELTLAMLWLMMNCFSASLSVKLFFNCSTISSLINERKNKLCCWKFWSRILPSIIRQWETSEPSVVVSLECYWPRIKIVVHNVRWNSNSCSKSTGKKTTFNWVQNFTAKYFHYIWLWLIELLLFEQEETIKIFSFNTRPGHTLSTDQWQLWIWLKCLFD